mmetsp:Transcript_30521/g.87164  ORF Transcript_30521/g.87164 Transcript_30521/m.87164 type:complete len:277 (-) Transcript_30521:380-1210(-)
MLAHVNAVKSRRKKICTSCARASQRGATCACADMVRPPGGSYCIAAAAPMLYAMSVEETRPTTCADSMPLLGTGGGAATTTWWTPFAAMTSAASANCASLLTARGSHWMCKARSQFTTGVLPGVRSTKARRMSRGVTTPRMPASPTSPATSTQFWRAKSISCTTWDIVAVCSQMGRDARGFITSATVLCVKRPASWEPPLRKPRQRARVRSRAERMPCGVAPSPFTSKWWQAKSPEACARITAAASVSEASGSTVSAPTMKFGSRAQSERNQASTG